MDNYCTHCGKPLNKMTRTLVNIVLDESGSMGPIRSDTIGGFTAYMDGLRTDDHEYLVTLTKFSAGSHVVHENAHLSSVQSLESHYRPSGGTALYDALGKSLAAIEKVATPTDKVLTLIITDGQENSSRTWTKRGIKQRIEALTERGNYTFVYLGADVDAMADGGAIGIAVGNTYQYRTHDHYQTMGNLATSTMSYASAANLGTSNFVEDHMSAPVDFQTKLPSPAKKETANKETATNG